MWGPPPLTTVFSTGPLHPSHLHLQWARTDSPSTLSHQSQWLTSAEGLNDWRWRVPPPMKLSLVSTFTLYTAQPQHRGGRLSLSRDNEGHNCLSSMSVRMMDVS